MNMNLLARQKLKKMTCGLGFLLSLSMVEAHAVNQEIRALFQPDPSQPNKNVFVNKTPNSGYCASYPDQCAANAMFSIQLPVRFTSNISLPPGWGIGIKVPADWRRLSVINTETQQTEIVEVRITGVGSNFVLSQPAHELVGVSDVLLGHQRLWDTSSWVYAPSLCQYSGVGAYTPSTYRFFWKTPVEAFCTKKTMYGIPSMYFDTLDFAYELRTPNPLGMSSGLYTGSLSYRLGPNGDFVIGTNFQPDDDTLTLDFVLDVQHTLKVDVPPGGNHVMLEPQGGWQRWLDSGRKPVRIFRDQTFFISSSSKFSMKLECEWVMQGACGIEASLPTGRYGAEVDVSVSLPNGLTDSVGQPVKRFKLGREPSAPFQPGIYVDRKPGMLHFELGEREIDFLIQHAGEKPFKGNITVIWDSEVG